MKNKEEEKILLSALSHGMDAEELLLAELQGLIAAEISMRRQELGLTQEQFAEKMGVSQSMVSRWESGDVNYQLSTLVKIAAALDLEVQPPIVLKAPIVYTSGNSNVYQFPGKQSWHSVSSAPGMKYYTSTVTESERLEM